MEDVYACNNFWTLKLRIAFSKLIIDCCLVRRFGADQRHK